VPGVVHGRSYDAETGIAGPRRDLFRVEDGVPDGLCVDAEGCLWIAIWGAGEVRRFTPDGRLVAVLAVPAPLTTSAAFVGPALDLLLVTTATRDMTPDQRAAWPDAGRLFLARPGVSGAPVAPWAGWVSAGGGA